MTTTDDTIKEFQQNTAEARMDFFKAMQLQRQMAEKRDDLNRTNKLLFPTLEL